ncbi:hypothetical protein [Streptomyces brasiliscabiei]|uniref:hypothetical protein n=1 Tax=Streptomyces brasiliscabiei TaxID=2736302 RepID=UPI001C122FDF|nr:hypothetical protein [Streptomyces brasiliscabiei]
MSGPSGQGERPGAAPGGMRAPVRMCVRCSEITDAPVVVSEVHQGTGPGFTVYACRDCAPRFPRVPDVLSLPPTDCRGEGRSPCDDKVPDNH